MPLIVRRVRKKKRAVDAPNDALANRGSSSDESSSQGRRLLPGRNNPLEAQEKRLSSLCALKSSTPLSRMRHEFRR